MNYQQDRDEAAENFATKNQTAIFIAGNTHQGTLNGFINGSDFGKQWQEKRVRALLNSIVETMTEFKEYGVVPKPSEILDLIKAYEEGK